MNLKVKLSTLTTWTVVFYISFSMIEQTKFVDVIPVGGFLLLARIAILFLFCFDLIQLRRSNKWAVVFVPIVFALSIASAFFSEKRYILELILILWLCRGLDIDRLVKNAVTCEFVVLTVTVVSSQIGLIENTANVRSGSSIVREGLGFNYTTYSANYFFHLVLCLTVLLKDKLKLWHVVVLELINVFIYRATDTRAVFYLCAVYIVVAYLIKYFKKELFRRKLASKIVVAVPAICTLICFLCCSLYDKNDARWIGLNVLLSGRLSLSRQALEDYGYSLFGQLVTWNTGLTSASSDSLPYFYVDSSFLNIAFVYGLIVLFILVVSFTLLAKKAVSQDNKWLCIVIIFLMLHSMTDPQLIELRYDLLLLYLAPMFNYVGSRADKYDLSRYSAESMA